MKLDFITVKKCLLLKEIVKTIRNSATHWEKRFAKDIADKRCYLKSKRTQTLTIRKQTTQLENGPIAIMNTLPKKIYT